MPNLRNKASMPKVRASSGTIGTISFPISGSFMRKRSKRTSTMVVASQLVELGVGQIGHQRQQLRLHAEEVLADVGTRFDGILLILPVIDLVHAADEHPVGIARQQRIPVVAPDHLDDIPPCAA